MLEIGQTLTVHYPRANRVDAKLQFAQRIIRIESIRDLVHHPLTPDEFRRRPMIYRGRYLIRGVTQSGLWRQFYQASTLEEFRVTPLRIAWYEEGSRMPVDILPHGFGATPRDRQILLSILERLEAEQPENVQLRIIADDLLRAG